MADYDYEVDVEPIHGSGARVAARLCNFAEGQTYMLQTHINWLRANVAHIVRSQKNSYVELFGFASKKGSPESNRRLSQGRCESVKNEVATYASQVNFKKNEGLGESSSGGGEHDNWGFWRRVEIYVFAEKPPPNFKPIPPPKPVNLNTKEFEIRILDLISVSHPSFPAGLDLYRFEIKDLKYSQKGIFAYTGTSIGIQLDAFSPPISLGWGAGPPSKFKTDKPIPVHDFDGAEVNVKVGAGASSGAGSIGGAVDLRFRRVFSEEFGGVYISPNPVELKTGSGISPGSAGSLGWGNLLWISG